jgi:KRAB domain-containing zinc finger protein
VLTVFSPRVHANREASSSSWKNFLHRQSQNLWNRHIEAHDKELILLCEFCGKQISNIWNMERHKTLHTQGKQLLCPAEGCQRTLRRQDLLDDYIKEHNREKYQCDICWRQLSWTTNLVDHKETHPLCPFESCHRRFKSKRLLSNHIEAHNREQPFPCTIEGCRQRFKHKELLNKNIEAHNRGIQCVFCGKTLLSTDGVKLYMKSHILGGIEYFLSILKPDLFK